MDAATFKRVVLTFVDQPVDLDLAKGKMLVQVRDELIEARLTTRAGAIHVEEGDATWPAERWLIDRLARISMLADRILTFVPAEPNFVVPGGSFLDQLEKAPGDSEAPVDDAVECARDVLDRRPGGTASVLYLTSDAGEGKTTVISHLARSQAQLYKEKATDWLVVPVALGGRPLLRLDEVIIAALVNRLRFPLLYYDAFIELVRMGVIIPALDGFEEIFVAGAEGEAVTALGNLMETMWSSGSVLIAARKAYFEHKRLETQARLFDALGDSSVAFARLALRRWNRQKFLEYGAKRSAPMAEHIYNAVSSLLGDDHPLLTRAVLVSRLFDVASETEGLEELLARLQAHPTDYFEQFVRAVVAREAREKWIDVTGEPVQPLITEDEHLELLANVAHEMWVGGSEGVRGEVLEFAAELFCETHNKPPRIRRQIVERVKQHALLVRESERALTFAFDHVEFYHFFLGYAVSRVMIAGNQADVLQLLRRGALPDLAMDVAAGRLAADRVGVESVIGSVCRIAYVESAASFVRENAGGVVARAISASGITGQTIQNLSFPIDALENRRVAENVFKRCYFQSTSVDARAVERCTFEDCDFDALELTGDRALEGVRFTECRVRSVVPPRSELAKFDPTHVRQVLEAAGAMFADVPVSAAPVATVEFDLPLQLTERVLRAFARATALNEGTLRQRLGPHHNLFFDEVVPRLIEAGVVRRIEYHGAGAQGRFRLGMQLRTLNGALQRCDGTFEGFLGLVVK